MEKILQLVIQKRTMVIIRCSNCSMQTFIKARINHSCSDYYYYHYYNYYYTPTNQL